MNPIFRALALLMTTSVVTILAGIVRQKVLALELGPVGIGQLGLLMTLTSAAATIGGLGLSKSGVQRVSITKDGEAALAAQKGLILGSLGLALLSGLVVLLLAPSLGLLPTGPDRWVTALAVILTIASAGQIALLNGLGRIRDIAWMNGLSAVLGTLLTVFLLFIVPAWGFYAAILSSPALLFGSGLVFRSRQSSFATYVPWQQAWRHLRPMIGLGVAFAAGLGIAAFGQYLARLYIGKRFGEVNLGQYQAVWSITMMYLGVILSSMAVEFFPRVSRVANKPNLLELNETVSTQIKLTLGLAIPVICLFILFSDVIIRLLYTEKFTEAAQLARIQFLGDIFKIAAWSFAYTLLARNARIYTFLSEVLWALVYLILLVTLPNRLGFSGVAWAYVGAYAVYFVISSSFFQIHTKQKVSKYVYIWVMAALTLAFLHLFIQPYHVGRWVLATLDLLGILTMGVWWFSNRIKSRNRLADTP